MALVIEHVERKVTAKWVVKAVALAVVVFSPVYVLVSLGKINPNGPLLLGVLVFVLALVPLSKKLPKETLEILRVRADGNLDLLLSKDPHQAVGSWWRHRVTVHSESIDRIRFAQSQAETSVPDVRWWYWVRFESGIGSLDTWIPDGLEVGLPESMRKLERTLGIPVVQEERIDIRRAYRYRRQQKIQAIPARQWP